MEDYILSHIDPEPEHLKRLYRDANLHLLYPRMMSGHLQGRFIKTLVEMINPKRVLELGTFAGYSTLCIAEALSDGASVDTIEIDDELQPFITQHFNASPYSRLINLHIGDAIELVPQLKRQYGAWDVVFIDADKRLYPEYYNIALECTRPHGWIIADNTLWNGQVTNIHTTPTNSKDRQLEGVMRFNDMVAADNRVEKIILPLRDGITIIRKKF